MATELKQQGNVLYSEGKIEESLLKYKEAIELLAGAEAGAIVVSNPNSINTTTLSVASTVAAKNLVPISKESPKSDPDASADVNKCSPTATDLSILYSNASQALYDLKQYTAAATSASAAVAHNPSNLKAWVRLVKAKVAEGSPFEAFIHYYLNVAPALRDGSKADQQEALKIVGADLGDFVAASVGVIDVNAGLALRRTRHSEPKRATGAAIPLLEGASASATPTVDTSRLIGSDDGGLSTVAVLPITADQVIFTEKQFVHAQLDAKAPNQTLNELSSETLIKHFSDQLVAAVRLPKAEAKKLWTQLASVMRGSWPRNLNEISPPLATHFLEELRTHHKKDIEEGFVVDEDAHEGTDGESSPKAPNKSAFTVTLKELAHMAVACRYNCFHSGFFRTCALANHSCNPNAAMKYIAAQNKVVMVAVRDIAPGEDITVKYLPDLEYVMGVSRRRELLYRSWLFWCDCDRCDADLFDKKNSKHEWIKCQKCKDPVNGYAHLPNRGLYSETADPSIPESSECFGCGEAVTLSKEQTLQALQTVELLFNRVRDERLTLVAMGDALMESWNGAAALVHEEHWTHRVQLYCFCLVLGDMIQSSFNFVASKQILPEECTEVLFSFGLAKVPNKGGDLLVALLELWRRIEPFYPSAQAWQLHLMITKLIVLNLMQPQKTAVMDYEEAAELLINHTPFIGVAERSAHLRVLMHRKDFDKDIKWSPNATKLVKKAFA
eukprot:GILK01008320.1.p1 GENE.GILK01008320.1~~GILK01008320.1.p1  ORF type:complete len:726 (+),score=73.14 GILK01008320.1:176-2353(+)